MRKLLIIPFILLLIIFCGNTQIDENLLVDSTCCANSTEIKEFNSGINQDTLNINNEDRFFRFYIPENLSDDASLIFRFHGAIASPNPIESIQSNYILNRIADTANIVVVYPQGTLSQSGTTKWTERDKDLAFFDEMLTYFQTNIPSINPKRVYVCGHSSGAIFSFTLAGYRADKIAAAVPVAGQINLTRDTEYPFLEDNISTHVRAYNGTADNTVNFEIAYNNINIW